MCFLIFSISLGDLLKAASNGDLQVVVAEGSADVFLDILNFSG